VSEHAYGGNGLAVLNGLLRLHFPHVEGTQAPSFDTATTKKVHQDSDELLPDYERHFTLWLQSLQLYREFARYPDSEVTMWFIDGLLARHQLFLSKEYVDLKKLYSTYRLIEHEPTLSNHLQLYFICECLRLSIGDKPRRAPRSTPMGSQVALIEDLKTLSLLSSQILTLLLFINIVRMATLRIIMVLHSLVALHSLEALSTLVMPWKRLLLASSLPVLVSLIRRTSAASATLPIV
jgi:hypothetical protein